MSTLITVQTAHTQHADLARDIERAHAVRRAIAEREDDAQQSEGLVARLVRAWRAGTTRRPIGTDRALSV